MLAGRAASELRRPIAERPGDGRPLHALRQRRQRPAHQRRADPVHRSGPRWRFRISPRPNPPREIVQAGCPGPAGSRPRRRHGPPSPHRVRQVRAVSTVMADTYDLVVIGAGPARPERGGARRVPRPLRAHRRARRPGGTVTTTGGAPTKTLREVALALRGRTRLRRTAAPTALARTLLAPRPNDRRLPRAARRCRASDRGERHRLRPGHGASGVEPASSSSIGPTAAAARSPPAPSCSPPARGRARLPAFPFDDPDVYDSNEIFAMRRTAGRPRHRRRRPGRRRVRDHLHGVRRAGDARRSRRPPAADDGRRAARADARRVRAPRRHADARSRRRFGRRGATAGCRVDAVGRTRARRRRRAVRRRPRRQHRGARPRGGRRRDRSRAAASSSIATSRRPAPASTRSATLVGPTLASVAMQQGRAAVCHALGLAFGVPVDRAPARPSTALPEIAGVGATEDQIRQRGIPYVVGRCDLSQTARGAIAGRGGRLKLIVRADDRQLLGVHCIGDIASELVGMGHAVLHMGGAVDVFLTLALNTPTYSLGLSRSGDRRDGTAGRLRAGVADRIPAGSRPCSRTDWRLITMNPRSRQSRKPRSIRRCRSWTRIITCTTACRRRSLALERRPPPLSHRRAARRHERRPQRRRPPCSWTPTRCTAPTARPSTASSARPSSPTARRR